MLISVQDVLAHLVGDGLVSSSFGAQLDRVKYGITGAGDPHRARDEIEDQMIQDATLLRTIDAFSQVLEFKPSSPKAPTYKSLEKMQKGTIPRLPQGQIALNVLRVFQYHGVRSQERGFLAVYGYLASIAPHKVPSLDMRMEDALQAFREGRAKRSRDLAATAYADALLALSSFLTQRNKRQ